MKSIVLFKTEAEGINDGKRRMIVKPEMASANPIPSDILRDGVFISKAIFMIFNKSGSSFCKIK
jgi:hypothetical protein